jgi:hypothetical protein
MHATNGIPLGCSLLLPVGHCEFRPNTKGRLLGYGDGRAVDRVGAGSHGGAGGAAAGWGGGGGGSGGGGWVDGYTAPPISTCSTGTSSGTSTTSTRLIRVRNPHGALPSLAATPP